MCNFISARHEGHMRLEVWEDKDVTCQSMYPLLDTTGTDSWQGFLGIKCERKIGNFLQIQGLQFNSLGVTVQCIWQVANHFRFALKSHNLACVLIKVII